MSLLPAVEIIVIVLLVLSLAVFLVLDLYRSVTRKRKPKKDDPLWVKILFG